MNKENLIPSSTEIVEEAEKEYLLRLEPSQVLQMKKGIMQHYGVEDAKDAKRLVIEYLSIEENRPTIQEFMRNKLLHTPEVDA